jgi:hypothetical protein
MDLGVTTKEYASDDPTWLGSAHGTDTGDSVTLNSDLFIAKLADVADGDMVPSGTYLGRVTADGTYGPYDPETPAVDGTEDFRGILWRPVRVRAGANVGGVMLRHGEIETDNLPYADDAAGGSDATAEGNPNGTLFTFI